MKLKEKIRSERGQGMVEFALCLPLLLSILCGILDFGWIYYNKYNVDHAAFEASRYGSVRYEEGMSSADINTLKSEMITTAKNVDNTVTVSPGDIVLTADSVKVTVKKDIPTLTFVASTVWGRNYHAKATCETAIND